MSGLFGGILSKLNSVNIKIGKYVDIFYLIVMTFFIFSNACLFVVVKGVAIIQIISSFLLMIIAFYRLIVEFAIDIKRALLALLLLVFCLICSMFSSEVIPLSTIAFAMVGAMEMRADYVLCTGISGNVLLIIYNIIMSFINDDTIILNLYQYRDFFYLGNDQFLMSKMNNCSTTNMAAHYFWMIAAYLWIRGKRIKWGEIVALGFLSLLIYALTGSNTSFLCIILLLLIASAMRLWLFVDKRFSLRHRIDSGEGLLKFVKIFCNYCARLFEFLMKFSFVIFAVFCILCSVLFSLNSPVFRRLNSILHFRLSLGHRGIVEYGVHLFAHDVPVFGVSSSADGFYNFIDCSYISILIISGILPLVFYLVVITIIQLKNKKYLYGAALLAVCALSCVEEHHLSEIYNNFFILLLFSDFEIDKKLTATTDMLKSRSSTIVNCVSVALSALFISGFAYIVIPQFKASKELNRLDKNAELIYWAVKDKLGRMVTDGTWKASIDMMTTDQYGYRLVFPSDYCDVVGESVYEELVDPNKHSFYYFAYSPSIANEDSVAVSGLLIDDEIKSFIGDGSVIIEYDLITGEVYSVWYSDDINCIQIDDGRYKDRRGRLLNGVQPEGYYVGVEYV